MNRQRSKDGKGFAAGSNDAGVQVVVDQATGKSINMPTTFNPQSISDQLQQLSDSPTVVSAYLLALRSRFRASQEIHLIDLMERKIKAAQGGIAAQTELIRLQREYLLAVERLKTMPDELTIEELKREEEKEALRLSIAQKVKARESVQSRSGGEPAGRDEELRKMEEKITHGIKKDVLKATMEAKRHLTLDEEKHKAKREATIVFLKRQGVQQVEDLSVEAFQELKKMLETIEDTFENTRTGAVD